MKTSIQILFVALGTLLFGTAALADVPAFKDLKVNPETVAQMIGPRQLIILYNAKPLNIMTDGKLDKRKDRFVSSMAVISAPPEAVRKVVLDFAKYSEFMPQTKKIEIEKQTDAEITVAYELEFQAPIMNLGIDYTLAYKLDPSGSITWHLLEGDLGENAGRWEFIPISGNRTLAVYTNWTDVESMSYVLKLFLKAQPDLKLAMPVASSAVIVDSIRRRVENTKSVAPKSVTATQPVIPVITSGEAPLSPETVLNLTEAGTVLFIHPRQWIQTSTGTIDMVFVSAAGLVNAPLDLTRRLSTEFARYPEFFNQVSKAQTTRTATNWDVDWKLKLGFGVFAVPINYSIAYTNSSASAITFRRTRGDMEHIYGAYEWISPNPQKTVVIYTTASELGSKAPAILKLGNMIPDRQLTIGASSSAVIIEKLGPWVEKQK